MNNNIYINDLNSEDFSSNNSTQKSSLKFSNKNENKYNKIKINNPMNLLIRRNELYEIINTSNKYNIPKPNFSFRKLNNNDSYESEFKYNNFSYSSFNSSNFRNSYSSLKKNNKLSSYIMKKNIEDNKKYLISIQNKNSIIKKRKSVKNLRKKCFSEKKHNISKFNISQFYKGKNKSQEKNNLKYNLTEIENNFILSEGNNLRGGRIDLLSSIYKTNKKDNDVLNNNNFNLNIKVDDSIDFNFNDVNDENIDLNTKINIYNDCVFGNKINNLKIKNNKFNSCDNENIKCNINDIYNDTIELYENYSTNKINNYKYSNHSKYSFSSNKENNKNILNYK